MGCWDPSRGGLVYIIGGVGSPFAPSLPPALLAGGECSPGHSCDAVEVPYQAWIRSFASRRGTRHSNFCVGSSPSAHVPTPAFHIPPLEQHQSVTTFHRASSSNHARLGH
mgnify:CR=1 FL=1